MSWPSEFNDWLPELNIKPVNRDARCILCKGFRMLCGKARCPVLIRFYSQIKVRTLINKVEIEGSSPPDIFVGRIGWPNVYAGPLIPPVIGDTSEMGTPERWKGKTIEEIVDFRSKLVRGKQRVNVNKTVGKVVDVIKELALSKSSTEIEAKFTKRPSGTLVLDDEVQPFGPSAPIKEIRLSSVKTDQTIEKAFSDTDLKAEEAVLLLYSKGIFVSRIQKAFSAGILGLGKQRRLVPTRWSITAVDDIISRNLIEDVKKFPTINEFRVYEHTALDNRWIVLMIPGFWSYEQMEGWYPGTSWNPKGKNVWIISDWEGFKGRSTYAATGGCYYSTRLAVGEKLVSEKRQATVITFREIHPGYILPVGVWHTRESIREAVKKEPATFNSLGESLAYIKSKLAVPLNKWVENSSLLKNLLYQKKISEFLRLVENASKRN